MAFILTDPHGIELLIEAIAVKTSLDGTLFAEELLMALAAKLLNFLLLMSTFVTTISTKYLLSELHSNGDQS
ncbi:hypothetical protein [Synechocystis sp. PCC 6714]|uniref:hypothetical protein n=1 Tax=Synechocystis sp. (strain PCC 6714) TaxID=1147 RepID=UPI0003F520B9|nr:hypothetical protein [Synechocystis sp. PCC 6714]AIE74132.1 hypothetical protein D082_16040 [Synechocystis sp. PCC 6714]